MKLFLIAALVLIVLAIATAWWAIGSKEVRDEAMKNSRDKR